MAVWMVEKLLEPVPSRWFAGGLGWKGEETGLRRYRIAHFDW